jgi:hypothetical protein
MARILRLVLDVLKPRHPSALEFAKAVAVRGEGGCRVKLTVEEVDEKTESIILVVEGQAIDFDAIAEAINDLGGSLHSIDEVEVDGRETAG